MQQGFTFLIPVTAACISRSFRCLTMRRSVGSLLRGSWNGVKKGAALPVFRFNKAFNVGRKLKVFLNLQSGLMRGALPEVDGRQEHAQKLRDARQLIKEQKKTLKFRERMISRLEYKLHHKEDFHVENKLRAKEWRGAGKPEPEVLPDFAI